MNNKHGFMAAKGIVILGIFLLVAGAGFAQTSTNKTTTPVPKVSPPPLIWAGDTPELAANLLTGGLEAAVIAPGDNYSMEIFYTSYADETGWSQPRQITHLGRDVKSVRLVIERNGTRYLVYEVADTVNRIYAMRWRAVDAGWSAPVLVSPVDTPSYDPVVTIRSRDAVFVVFRSEQAATNGQGGISTKTVIVNLQEDIPIW